MDSEGNMPQLSRYDDGEEHETLTPRVVGSSRAPLELGGAPLVEASGVLSRGREVHSPTPSARFGEVSPRPIPKPRRLSEVSDDSSPAPTPRVSAILRASKGVQRLHDAQWRGANEATDVAHESQENQHIEDTRENLGMGSQWRPMQQQPTTTDVNLLMVRTLEKMTAQLEQLSVRGPLEEPEFEFSGKTTEDPVAFFNQFEDWLIKHQTPETRYHRVFRRCLRGEAFEWFAGVQDQEWPFVRTLFLQKYDAPANKGALYRELFGRYQAVREKVSPFIMEKWALFKRLAPTMPEAERVQTVHGLLLPRIRAYTRGLRCESLQELMEQAALVEQDLQDEDRMTKTTAPEPRQQTNVGYPTRAPPTTNRAPPPPARTAIPPSPCRWCNGPHYNNECPTRQPAPQRQVPQPAPRTSVNPSQRENDTRAPATARDRRQ